MRLDKFLKISRIIKRRPVAKSIAEQGRVKVNDRVAKSSTNVNADDTIKIEFGNKILTVKVLQIMDRTKKADAEKMYEIISEDYHHDYQHEQFSDNKE